jgi:hypothetical protein
MKEWWARILGLRTSPTDSSSTLKAVSDEIFDGEVKPVLRESGG